MIEVNLFTKQKSLIDIEKKYVTKEEKRGGKRKLGI